MVEFTFSNILVSLILLGLLVLWIWMLIDAFRRKFEDPSDKFFWIIVLILIISIGSIVYYFVIYKKNGRNNDINEGVEKNLDVEKKKNSQNEVVEDEP